MSSPAPAVAAPPRRPDDDAPDRLPGLLRADPVSRHTRIVLWVLAGLLLAFEVLAFVFEPALLQWGMDDPAIQAEIMADPSGEPSMGPREGFGLVLRVALALFGVLCTLLFAWQPSVAASLVLAASAVLLAGLVGTDHEQLTPLSVAGGWVVGAVMVARYSRRAFVWTALAALAALVVAAELLAGPGTEAVPSAEGAFAFLGVVAVLAALPALFVRRIRHRARDRQLALEAAERRVQEAAEAERQRIAAELHDVVAHGLTVISMQASMLPTLTDPERRRGAEEAIETAARQSLVDLRRMLTALRGSARNETTQDPDGVADLPGRLVEFRQRLEAAGYRVEGELSGVADLPESLRLTVLRVAQEATTNVLKHGPGAGTVVLSARLDEQGRLVLRMDSPRGPAHAGSHASERPDRAERGEPRRPRPLPASGFGLAGMVERVGLFGGSIAAGPRDDRWVVEAVLPTR